MSNNQSYGGKLVNFMLRKEQVIIPFRSCYYLLYQCLVPNTREALSLLVQHYSVPKDFKRSILSGENPRVCNQGILNYLLIVLRRDKDITKFWKVLQSLTNQPELRKVIGQVQKSIHCSLHSMVPDGIRSIFPTDAAALSVTDSDDDYCISYTVTMVDVRSCTRSPRSDESETRMVIKHNTMEEFLINQLETVLIETPGLSVIKKHFGKLCSILPNNYQKTTKRLQQLIDLAEEDVMLILSSTDDQLTDPVAVNQRILMYLFMNCQSYDQLMNTCIILEELVDPVQQLSICNFQQDLIFYLNENNKQAKENHHYINQDSVPVYSSMSDKDERIAMEINLDMLKFNHYGYTDERIAMEINLDMLKFTHFGYTGAVLLRKHYNELWMSLPEDYIITLQKLYKPGKIIDVNKITGFIDLVISCPNAPLSNKMILDILIFTAKSDTQLLGFSYLLEKLVQDSKVAVVKLFRNDCVEMLIKKATAVPVQDEILPESNTSHAHTTSPTAITAQLPDLKVADSTSKLEICAREYEVFKASYAKLANVLPVKSLSHQLVSNEIITIDEEEEIASIPTSKEKASFVLRKIARSLEAGITHSYYTLLTIMKNHGGDVAVLADQIIHNFSVLNDSSNISGRLLAKKANKRIQYQPPLSCPTNYIPRVEILKKISSAILNSDITPTIGTTVTIRGIGGIGKSTIAKALCHEPLIEEHFTDGFLWISLTPPLSNPVNLLSEVYQQLTDKSVKKNNASILKNKIKSLILSHDCKLLVILDDAWSAEDASVFIDVFSSCKIILTTRKMDINSVIHPKVCFDIDPMSIDEAQKLLTLQVIDLKTLSTKDVSRIKELAKDLHCWPLLLNLVHGQLYVHCIEWNESPQDAILKVHQKLYKYGLTAFDLSSCGSRDNAVKASITASLELLTKDEEMMLYHIASSLAGFGVYTCKDILPTLLKIDSEQFDICANHLWCQGLISFESLMLPFATVKIPCIKIHDLIAQYINEQMPSEYYRAVVPAEFADFSLNTLFEDIEGDVNTNIGLFILAKIDIFILPFFIRTMMITAKFVYMQIIIDKLKDNDQAITLQQVLDSEFYRLKQSHRIIKEDCKSIHMLLADNKHDEALVWVKQYFEHHPLNKILTKATIYFNTLSESFPGQTSIINELILGYDKYFAKCQTMMSQYITNHSHILLLINSGAADEDIQHYLYCANIFTV